MSAVTLDGTTIETTLTTPAWATSTIEPEAGSHEGTVTVGPVTLTIGQGIPFTGEPEPIYVWLPEVDRVVGAQACRDLAAALLEAAEIIDAERGQYKPGEVEEIFDVGREYQRRVTAREAAQIIDNA